MRFLFLILILQLSLFALNPLIDKQIRSIIDNKEYEKYEKLIDLIFGNQSLFMNNGKVNNIKIIKTLKENGLLKLYFKKPQVIKVAFQTGGNASFFMKILRDTLRSIGYYRYFTIKAIRNNRSFIWEIQFKSEYAIDPVVLEEALKKRNCQITTMSRTSATHWRYDIDIENAHLFVKTLLPQQLIYLKKSLRPYLLDISKGKKLTITTKNNDAWFPSIVIFDEKMRLLKIYKRENKTEEVTFYLPKESVYIKITDSFNQSNLKHGLDLLLTGEK